MRLSFTVLAIIVMLTNSARAELPAASATIVNQALSSGKPTLIDFGLHTCNVCKKMAPYLESLSNDYRGRANILFIDVRADQATAQKFRVQMLPTQIHQHCFLFSQQRDQFLLSIFMSARVS